ncbi:MAG: hypothetical protein WC616_01405 [Candidatus Omnitrophota bacterium]
MPTPTVKKFLATSQAVRIARQQGAGDNVLKKIVTDAGYAVPNFIMAYKEQNKVRDQFIKSTRMNIPEGQKMLARGVSVGRGALSGILSGGAPLIPETAFEKARLTPVDRAVAYETGAIPASVYGGVLTRAGMLKRVAEKGLKSLAKVTLGGGVAGAGLSAGIQALSGEGVTAKETLKGAAAMAGLVHYAPGAITSLFKGGKGVGGKGMGWVGKELRSPLWEKKVVTPAESYVSSIKKKALQEGTKKQTWTPEEIDKIAKPVVSTPAQTSNAIAAYKGEKLLYERGKQIKKAAITNLVAVATYKGYKMPQESAADRKTRMLLIDSQ